MPFATRPREPNAKSDKAMSALALVVEDEPILGRNIRTFLATRG